MNKEQEQSYIEQQKGFFLERLNEQFKEFGGTKSLEEQLQQASERTGLPMDDISVMKSVMATSLSQDGGMLVKLHIGRTRFERKPDYKMNGLNVDKYKDLAEHMEKYAQLGKRLIINRYFNEHLNYIEHKARSTTYEFTIPAIGEYRFVQNDLIPKLRDKLQELKQNYFSALQVIHDNYERIIDDAIQNYRKAAPEIYRLYEQDPDAKVPEDWVNQFESFVRNSFPEKESILDKAFFKVEWDFVPETNFLVQMRAKEDAIDKKIANLRKQLALEQQKITEAKRMQDHKERVRREVMKEEKRQQLAILEAQQAEFKRIAKEKADEMAGKMDKLVGNVVGHLYTMVEEGVMAVKDSIAKNGFLPTSHGKQIARLIERVQALNPNNQDIKEQLEQLQNIVSTDTAISENEDMVVKTLNEITEYNRSALVMLGQPPRRKRRKGVQTQNNQPTNQVITRNKRDAKNIVPEKIENVIVTPRRQRNVTLADFWENEGTKAVV